MPKKFAAALLFLATTTSGFAFEISGDSASVEMRITSVISHETGSTITASGPVEGYGKVWVTLELTSSDSNRNQCVLGGQVQFLAVYDCGVNTTCTEQVQLGVLPRIKS